MRLGGRVGFEHYSHKIVLGGRVGFEYYSHKIVHPKALMLA